MAQKIATTLTITEGVRQCANAFSNILLHAASGQEVPSLSMLKEQHARFSIWAKELRVAVKDVLPPEYYVLHTEETKNMIIKVLQQLKGNLKVALNQNPNTQVSNKPEETNDEDEYSSDSSLGISEVDDTESELELATEGELARNKHIDAIDQAITHLYRFLSIMKHQYASGEDQRISCWVSKEGRPLEHQLKALELYMSYLLERNFPDLQLFLKDRLIQTVIQRRRRLLYRETHTVKRGKPNAGVNTLAFRHQDAQDIQPFICLFQGCDTPLRQFETTDDWINHMASQHAQVWVCQVKGHENWRAKNPAQLKTHLHEEHPDVAHSDQISFFATKSARAGLDVFGALVAENMAENTEVLPTCPFCSLDVSVFEPEHQLEALAYGCTADIPREIHQKIQDHISTHLKLIALESLPIHLQAPQSTLAQSVKIAIICDNPLITRAISSLFNARWYEGEFAKEYAGDLNPYSLGAIGRHNVVLMHRLPTQNIDPKQVRERRQRSFPYIEFVLQVGMGHVSSPASASQIAFGDVIVGHNFDMDGLLDTSSLHYKLRVRLQSLFGKMKSLPVREMLQHNMATNVKVLEAYDRSSCHPKPMRCKNGGPDPHYHLNNIDRFELTSQFSTSRSVTVVSKRDNNRSDKKHIGGLLGSLPCVIVEGADFSMANDQITQCQPYAAATVAALSSAVLGLWPYSVSTGTLFRHPAYCIPIAKNKHFVERKEAMNSLRKKLFQDDMKDVFISGQDGMGKTQLALWLAYWVKENIQDHSVFWATAISLEAFEHDCNEIVKSLADQYTDGDDPKLAFQRYLSSDNAGNWILILDEASDKLLSYGRYDQDLDFRKFLPINHRGRIIRTTQSENIAASPDAVVRLSTMTVEESISLLDKSLVREDQLSHQPWKRKVVEILSCYPLAISQAAIYIEINKVPVGVYHQLLHKEPRHWAFNSPTSAVTRTSSVSFRLIQNHHKLAANILFFLAFIEPRAIPSWILPGAENDKEFKKAVSILCEYGFIRPLCNSLVFNMRSCIHQALHTLINKHDVADHDKGVIGAHIMRVFSPENLENHQLWHRYLPHMLKTLRFAEYLNRDFYDKCRQVGWHLEKSGSVGQAIQMFEGLVDSQSRALVEDEAYYVTLEFELGRLYRSNSQTAKAIDLLEHVVATRVRTLSESHPDRLASENELAKAYQENGQHRRAIMLLEQLAAVRGKVDAVDSPDLLEIQRQLANAYLSIGRSNEHTKLS